MILIQHFDFRFSRSRKEQAHHRWSTCQGFYAEFMGGRSVARQIPSRGRIKKGASLAQIDLETF